VAEIKSRVYARQAGVEATPGDAAEAEAAKREGHRVRR
jgi:hypothetical protein